ncbi:MAG: ribbon-helix-helix domain-containing protein [archaeon]
MKPIQVRLTNKLKEKLDEEVAKGIYPNRSEAMRDAIRRLIQNQKGDENG